ncbi:hypothetical protein HH214_08340 [Mucilaginibacter robiniae]|uniref:Uracil-DNA glycosylase-like domain-containing protein n=1 Tax=Mucilaginibacter robiniae TaxID=2728022 RepID=A0A7L5DYM3_9SPHI|nr:hypothetical protein [Mucilaginibacter robiniae]QJD95881.1 hypothetical protein HH214_08340 [Mucilaginibacter robiniae]
MEITELTALKQQYKPERIQLLFIADGRPVNNKYFYLKNSNMYKAVKAAFTQVFGEFNNDEEFLQFFKEMGCYFENLSAAPIKNLPPPEQKAERTKGVQPLAERIAEHQPRLVIISLKVIEKYAREAISLSGVSTIENVVVTPFPVKSLTNVNNCINGIVAALRSIDWGI